MKPVSSRKPLEYTPKGGLHYPDTARTSRAIMPSYQDTHITLLRTETVVIALPVGSLGTGAAQMVSGSQGLQRITNLNLAPYDTGQLIISGVSVDGPTNTFPGCPHITFTAPDGTVLIGGNLQPGTLYKTINFTASVSVYAVAPSSAGTVNVSANILLIGNGLGN